MKTLTVFTPTYNRAYCLPECYKILCRQSSKDFNWLVIDDGSTDNTRELVNGWIKENKIHITYHYQQNQGMHGAHNAAYRLIETELNTCIDSDDFMPDDAVEIILKNVENLETKFAGLVGLDADKNGNIIGTKMPEQVTECTLSELYQKQRVIGDKKLVYKTEIINKYPEYPLFKGERFVPLGYLYSLIDQDYKLKVVNEVLVIVEYQTDGSTKNILYQYRNNPRGFAFSRISRINLARGFKEKFKNAIHLVSSALFVKDINLLMENKKPFLIMLAFPFGVLLNLYIRQKTSSH